MLNNVAQHPKGSRYWYGIAIHPPIHPSIVHLTNICLTSAPCWNEATRQRDLELNERDMASVLMGLQSTGGDKKSLC